ncbi:homing endonuclease associated repeat-containing protein [Natrinema salsiterrestre]|uniref:C2H2-type domain-containing protein n=1 Tax=Natrinema salsiterrestre TaxID=2950540 RepID=A0A9Q4L5Z8_9EURY|nr:hypothetical protein [Natrinema salsiterrestre]MDF9747919.1 hypothetical protein [Natrinema salsiterrestre]
MSEDTNEYVCEFCGEDFKSGSKKAGHISWYHRDDRQEEDLITELQRLATEKGRPPEMGEMDTKGGTISAASIDGRQLRVSCLDRRA